MDQIRSCVEGSNARAESSFSTTLKVKKKKREQ